MEYIAQIEERVRRLPESSQAEVLHFVEFLLATVTRNENRAWGDFSLAAALHGMDNEDSQQFAETDIKEPYA